MTEIPAPSLTGAHGKPKRCRRHRVWVGFCSPYVCRHGGATYQMADPTLHCPVCGQLKDEARSRRGRNARKRGNHLQAKAAKSAGIANIGALGLPEDAGTSTEWMRIQHKSGLGYPKRLDQWLRALTVTADQLRAVVYTETPGPGHKARRLVILDYDEFLLWFGPNKVIR